MSEPSPEVVLLARLSEMPPEFVLYARELWRCHSGRPGHVTVRYHFGYGSGWHPELVSEREAVAETMEAR